MKVVYVAIAILVTVALLGCVQQSEEKTQTTPTPARAISLNGAGATFPFPLIDKWAAEYYKLKPNVKVNYQSIGSGGGIRQHIAKTVDFAASDAPLTDEQFRDAPNTLHVPFTIGGVVPIYNLPGIQKGLRFTGEILADIYLGKIKKWNDPRIVAINPNVELPDKEIIVVHRSDGSGTTFVWTNYLSRVSKEWSEKVGMGTSVNWPVGIGGKGNEGVTALVMQTPYSIGYVEFTYAKKNNLPYGYVQNAAGEFVEPSIESFAKAAEYAALTLPKGNESWSKVSIIDSIVNNRDAKGAYPITSFSYFLIYRELNVVPGMDEGKARSLAEFLWWVIHDGQSYAPGLYYVPIPQNVVTLNEETLKMLTYNGKPLLK